MQHIRTKWHHVLPLIKEEQVYITAPKNGKSAFFRDVGLNPERLKAFVEDVSDLPRFVVDRELIDLATKGEYTQSLIDMKRAGVLRLPYREMIIEFQQRTSENRAAHSIVLLRDLCNKDETANKWEANDVVKSMKDEKEEFDFYGLRMSVEVDKDGEYLCMSPSVLYMAINSKDVVSSDVRSEWVDYSDDTCWLRMLGHGHSLLPPTRKTNELVEATWTKDAGTVYYAAVAAYLLMATAGIAKEYIDCEKINRKRGDGSDKPKIPPHTYIRIGRVYRSASSDVSDEYIARRSPRPYWRRGHLRNVHYGEGRAFTRSRYILPKLCAYKGSEQPIPPVGKEYVVTR